MRNRISSQVRWSLLGTACLLLMGCDVFSGLTGDKLDLSKTSDFEVKVRGGELQDSSFFPLRLGAVWIYKQVHGKEVSDSLKTFTMAVVGTHILEGTEYYVVNSYFTPGPSLPKPTLVRKSEDQVFVHIDGEDHLLYSFSGDSTWSVPMYANQSTLYARAAKRQMSTAESVVVVWDLEGFPGPKPIPGRTESGWGEVFERGRGRVRLVSVSQVYGTRVWDLIEVNIGG